MARERKPAGSLFQKLLFWIVIFASVTLMLLGMIIAFILCVDHVSEFFNGWNYKNGWEPFHGNFVDFVRQIPKEAGFAVSRFPEACFITLIFYPMFVILIAFYEVAYGEYTMLLYGWLPFFVGMFSMIFFAFALLREPENPNAGKYDKI